MAPALNGRLPASIRVRESVARPADWHAHSATYRRYRYTIYNGRRPNLFLSPRSWHRYQLRLDHERMQQALEHAGFTTSRPSCAPAVAGPARTTIQEVAVHREGDILRVEICQRLPLRHGAR